MGGSKLVRRGSAEIQLWLLFGALRRVQGCDEVLFTEISMCHSYMTHYDTIEEQRDRGIGLIRGIEVGSLQ